MTDYFPKKPLDYPGFVEELEELLHEAGGLEAVGSWDADDNAFRRWRARLIDLLVRVRKVGYPDVRCEVEDRKFKYYGPEMNPMYAANHFERHLDDTMIELQLIVDNFKKHGDPHAEAQKAESKTETQPEAKIVRLEKPETITMPWIWRSTAASTLWGWFISGLIFIGATFMLGMAAGGTPVGQSIIAKVTPGPTVGPAPAHK